MRNDSEYKETCIIYLTSWYQTVAKTDVANDDRGVRETLEGYLHQTRKKRGGGEKTREGSWGGGGIRTDSSVPGQNCSTNGAESGISVWTRSRSPSEPGSLPMSR